jgi:hypothetical protein
MVEDEVVAAQLEALVTPAITALENYYRRLGLRDRILNLPLMVAALLTLSRAGCGRSQRANPHPGEGRFFMVSSHTSISTSPVSKILDLSGLSCSPRVFKELLPQLKQARSSRTRRLEPESIQLARRWFEQIWIADSSTLEAL